ncbi:uncharacterized protein LOC133513097 [Syngnathoides biaculeatus]|uniref:uncharacterized protein LOC133513097 n=1 Tax=Syngnathoides biaculeatus TaxID=300417 RepID=UPI002ADE1B6E|nr:uncharacterized protein LOC133513097 [Syngnathoides biaculeatus]
MYRQQTEVSFSKKIKQVEDRFSADQESSAAHFQADILKLEWNYQSELRELSESHAEQKLCWEARLQRALESAEEWRIKTEEGGEGLHREWAEERLELEKVHREAMLALVKKNQQLQHQVEISATAAQTKEIELSHQLNNLHSRLQESLQAKEDLLAHSDKQAKDAEHLLIQTVEDFRLEREEFHSSHSQLQAQYEDLLSVSHRQTEGRILLLTERDDLKLKIEETDKILKQAVDDFELDRKELQEQVAFLIDELKKSQTQDLALGVSKNGEMVTPSISDNPVSEQDLKVEGDPMVESAEDLLQLKTSASENQDLHVSWTCNTNVSSKRCNNLETSNFDDPYDHPEVVLCQEDPRMTTDREVPETDGNAKDCASSHSQCQKKNASGTLEFYKEESGPHDVLAATSKSPSPKDQNADYDPGSEFGVEDLNGQQKNVSRETFDLDVDDELQNLSIFELQFAYCQTREERLLMQEKILLLQQKIELLQSLLEHNSRKIQTGRAYLEENYNLKVKMFLLMEHIKVLEMKASKLKELQTRYDDCLGENAELKAQNAELIKKVWRLKSSESDEVLSLTNDISRMQRENHKLSEMFMEFEAQMDSLDLGFPSSRISETSDLIDSSGEFEVETADFHEATSELPETNRTTRPNR